MTMNPFEQSKQQLLHSLTSQVEQEVIDYIRQEIQHDAPESVPTADELLTFFQFPDEPTELDAYLAIRFSSFSTPIIALSAEKSEDVAQRKMPCRHSSNVTPFPAKQAFTTKSPQRKR